MYHYRITIAGYDYYRRLKAPNAYWIKKNWFAVTVLVVTSAVTVGSHLLVVWLDDHRDRRPPLLQSSRLKHRDQWQSQCAIKGDRTVCRLQKSSCSRSTALD